MHRNRNSNDVLWRLVAARPACWLLFVVVLAVAGCTKDGFEPTITQPIPAHYAGSKSGQSVAVGAWWRRFGSGELDALVATADVENLDVPIAAAQLAAAEAQVRVAGATLFPTLSGSGDATRTRSSGTSSPGVITSASQRDSYSLGLNASYVLDVWGQNRAQLEAAIHTATASAYQVEVVRLTALATVVNNYLLFAANRERVAVAGRNLANAERILGIIKERQAAGTASTFDAAQEGTLVETERATIPPLREAAETARTALALAIGHPVQDVQLKRAAVQSLRVPSVAAGLPSALLTRRPDIRESEQQLAAADANVEAARAAFFPTIQLTGQLGYQSALLSTLVRPESLVFSAAGSLTQPIFDGGRLRGQLALTEAQRQQLLETYRRSILSALVDVENALIAIRETTARETAQRRAVDLARQAFMLGEARLREGTIDLTTLLTTQNALFQAEDSLIQVRLARLQALVSLFQALGGDWGDEAQRAAAPAGPM